MRKFFNFTRRSSAVSFIPHHFYRIVAALVGVVALFVWFSRSPDKSAAPSTGNSAVSQPANKGGSLTSLRDGFEQALKQTTPDQESVRPLHLSLLSSPKPQAVALIREFLASGKDRATGMEFEIESGGSLKSWPTLRTMLLDVLAIIDPAAAADIAREILAKPTTADEWALALRNLGRTERSPENDGFLLAKTTELIRNPEWQAAPSVGYLNSFDVLVHLQATSETPLLSGLIQNKERKDLAHAAFLTLDRLVQLQPADALTRIAADTALQQSRPEMTAQQFARADLRDPAQQAIVKTWLLDPARTSAELRSFAGVYPNNNHFVSNNLLTTEAAQSGTNLAAHDREALEILKIWREDPEFEPIREHLAAMTARLEQFTSPATTPEP